MQRFTGSVAITASRATKDLQLGESKSPSTVRIPLSPPLRKIPLLYWQRVGRGSLYREGLIRGPEPLARTCSWPIASRTISWPATSVYNELRATELLVHTLSEPILERQSVNDVTVLRVTRRLSCWAPRRS